MLHITLMLHLYSMIGPLEYLLYINRRVRSVGYKIGKGIPKSENNINREGEQGTCE